MHSGSNTTSYPPKGDGSHRVVAVVFQALDPLGDFPGLGEHPVRLILDLIGDHSKISASLPAWAASRAAILRFVRRWPIGLLIRILAR